MGDWAGIVSRCAAAALFAATAVCARAEDKAAAPAAKPPIFSPIYVIRADHWSPVDERDYGSFVAELGESGCTTVNACLHDPRNPFRASDPAGVVFASDCADLPYVLRFYFAWKRGLPFSYESEVEARGPSNDLRYSRNGNSVTARIDVAGGEKTGYQILDELRDAVSSASYRIHPDLEEPYEPDHYSPALRPGSIRPGTVVYDPNGHLITVWRIDPDGRIHYMDAHPDYSVTRGFYDLRFVRSSPGMGAGFKNWRPQRLVGATKLADGTYAGGHIELTPNSQIADFSDEQFYGNGPRPDADSHWSESILR